MISAGWPSRFLLVLAALVALAAPDFAPSALAQEPPSAGAGVPDASISAADGSETPVSSLAATAGEPTARTVEAQVAYRNGRLAEVRGQLDVARRHYAEASRLEPGFADPWFAAAGTWFPLRPDLAIGNVVDGLRASWRTFRGQNRLVLNAALLLLSILSWTVIGTAILVTVRGLRHFQHPIFEVIHRRLPAAAAVIAAWIIVAQPVLWGIGVYLLLVLGAGHLWFYMNRGERTVAGAVVALALVVPLSFHGISRIAAPLHPDSTPYLLSAATDTPDQPGLREALNRATKADPTDPSPHMALGLVLEASGDIPGAEREFRRALELNGDTGRLRNNLGNILTRSGRFDDAVAEYQAAIAAAPELAAPHYNLSLLYARRLQFDLADAAMKKASEIDFEGVRAQTAGRTPDQASLMSLGLSPADLWSATLAAPPAFQLGMPRSLGWLYGGSPGFLPFITALLFIAGLVVGRSLHRFLPTYSCANCDAIVCRKCLRRIRRRAYCASCGDTILSMQTSEFTRMLLERRLKEEPIVRRIAGYAMKLLIPGWEAVRRGRPLVGLTVMGAFMLLLVPTLFRGQAVRAVPSLVDAGGGPIWTLLVPGLVVLYGLSALLLRILPEPEMPLMGNDLHSAPGRVDRLDRAA
jgi:tetratricopeptide (TPR) repeat protein